MKPFLFIFVFILLSSSVLAVPLIDAAEHYYNFTTEDDAIIDEFTTCFSCNVTNAVTNEFELLDISGSLGDGDGFVGFGSNYPVRQPYYPYVGYPAPFLSPTSFGSFTECFNVQSTFDASSIIDDYDGTNNGYSIYRPSQGDLQFSAPEYGCSETLPEPMDSVQTWYHLCLRYNNITNNVTWFVNGQIEASFTCQFDPTTEEAIQIGFEGDNLDELGFWSSALTDSDIEFIYNSLVNGSSYPFNLILPETPLDDAGDTSFVNNIQTCDETNYTPYITLVVIVSLLFTFLVPYIKSINGTEWLFGIFMLIIGVTAVLMLTSGC